MTNCTNCEVLEDAILALKEEVKRYRNHKNTLVKQVDELKQKLQEEKNMLQNTFHGMKNQIETLEKQNEILKNQLYHLKKYISGDVPK